MVALAHMGDNTPPAVSTISLLSVFGKAKPFIAISTPSIAADWWGERGCVNKYCSGCSLLQLLAMWALTKSRSRSLIPACTGFQ